MEGLREHLDIERSGRRRGPQGGLAVLRLVLWVWLVAMLATGALLGALVAFRIGGTITAHEFGNHTRIFCVSAGGQVVAQQDGTSYCAVWIDKEPEAETGPKG